MLIVLAGPSHGRVDAMLKQVQHDVFWGRTWLSCLLGGLLRCCTSRKDRVGDDHVAKIPLLRRGMTEWGLIYS